MLNNLRGQLKLLFGLLKHSEEEAVIVARRDIGIIHDNLVKIEAEAVVISAKTLHAFKALFTPSTDPEVVSEVEGAIKHVDDCRALHKLPPYGAPTPAVEANAEVVAPTAPLAPVVPFPKA
jgi:hypothetical protein